MKKIFTLVAVAAFAGTAFANHYVTNLDNTLVMYTTNDTISSGIGVVENEDTGEEEETIVPIYWTGADMVNGFNKCGIPLTGTSTTQTNYKFTTRNSYTDPETGFSMPAGSYRGVFIDGTININGALDGNTMEGYSNIKSVVLYFAPVPTTWVSGGVSHQDYPTGRVQARYVAVDDTSCTKVSNLAYRELHMDMYDVLSDDTHSIKGTKVCNFSRSTDALLDATIDQAYKLTVNVQNLHDGSYYEDIFENATNKQSEFANLMCDTTGYASEMSYYFADLATCCPYYEPDRMGIDCATGYDCYNGKWGTKVDWTTNTVLQIGVKKRLYLFGIALVSATDGATSKFMNAADKLNAAWSDSAVAYGSYGDAGINTVNNDRQQTTRIYNLNGQQISNAKGLCIINGKVSFVK